MTNDNFPMSLNGIHITSSSWFFSSFDVFLFFTDVTGLPLFWNLELSRNSAKVGERAQSRGIIMGKSQNLCSRGLSELFDGDIWLTKLRCHRHAVTTDV